MNLKQRMLGILVLLLAGTPDNTGQLLLEDSVNRVTACEGEILRGSCPANNVIAVKDIKYGTTNCALHANDPECCDYESTDCLTDYTGTAQQAACSGRGLCHEVTIGEAVTSTCGSPYPDQNHYLTMAFYCIPESRIRNMCDESESLNATGIPLYTWNNDYPSGPIRAASTSCSCSIEASSCNSQINVYFVHFQLSDGGGSCSNDQNIQIDDKGSIRTYTCLQNNNYEITTKMTSSSNYITVTLDNAAGIEAGKFWMGFEATEGSVLLSLDCPVKEQVLCKDCISLGTLANGSVTYSSGTTFQSIATFACDTGYTLEGDTTRTCQANASWSNSNSSCKINDCGTLTVPADGSITYSSGTTFRSIATFGCDTGYTLEGDSTRTCQANASWSNNIYPSCKINDCGALSSPTHSTIQYTDDTVYQSVASYSCDIGYSVEGQSTRICQADASWSHTEPTCVIKDCRTFNGPENGNVTYPNGTTYQSVAILSCYTGYTLFGPPSKECQADGSWTHTNTACYQDCESLSAPENGVININETIYDSRAIFSCQTDHKLNGSSVLRCESDGSWSSETPTCEVIIVEDATSKTMMIVLAVLAAVFVVGGVAASGLLWKNVQMKYGLSRSAEANPFEYIKTQNSFGSDSAMPIKSGAIQQNINGLHPEYRKEHHKYFLEHPKQKL